MISNRDITITIYVTVKEVQRAIGCSRSAAYEHLRKAAGRDKGKRGMLRVPVDRWERYASETFGGKKAKKRSNETRTSRHLRGNRSGGWLHDSCDNGSLRA